VRRTRRTHWWGSGHETEARSKRAAEENLQASWGNSGEESRPQEGKSGALRLGLAPARGGECCGPTLGLRTGPVWLGTARGRRAGAVERRQGRISHDKAELKETEHVSEFLTSGRHSRRLGAASDGLDDRHDGHGSPARAEHERE
jgi:hypothetical protein